MFLQRESRTVHYVKKFSDSTRMDNSTLAALCAQYVTATAIDRSLPGNKNGWQHTLPAVRFLNSRI